MNSLVQNRVGLSELRSTLKTLKKPSVKSGIGGRPKSNGGQAISYRVPTPPTGELAGRGLFTREKCRVLAYRDITWRKVGASPATLPPPPAKLRRIYDPVRAAILFVSAR